MIDFDESLPSSSNFLGENTFQSRVNSNGGESTNYVNEKPVQHSYNHQDDDELEMSSFNRSPSPPPPPPPLTQSMRTEFKGINANLFNGGEPSPQSSPEKKENRSSGPFPFLKRGR